MRNRPVLDARQAYYYDVFRQCARGRQVSMAGPLSLDVVTKIRDYCELFHIQTLNERGRLVRYVSIIDDAFLEYVAEKQKK